MFGLAWLEHLVLVAAAPPRQVFTILMQLQIFLFKLSQIVYKLVNANVFHSNYVYYYTNK